MDKLSEMQLLDLKKFFKEEGDPGFSPARNRAIIDGTIKKHDQNIEKKRKLYNELYGERVDAIATYFRSLNMGRSDSKLEGYFGKKNLAFLRGDEIRKELYAKMKIYNDDGELIKLNFD